MLSRLWRTCLRMALFWYAFRLSTGFKFEGPEPIRSRCWSLGGIFGKSVDVSLAPKFFFHVISYFQNMIQNMLFTVPTFPNITKKEESNWFWHYCYLRQPYLQYLLFIWWQFFELNTFFSILSKNQHTFWSVFAIFCWKFKMQTKWN